VTTEIRATALSELPVGEARRFSVGGDREVCLVNLGADGVRAISAECSHAHAYMDEGDVDVDDHTIECPRHGSVFDLDTGAAKSLPATSPVQVFGVRVEDDDVLVEVS
jgi:3-phenylpropionate/trans-cinnamate dioxygenase ferredoxin subunit